MGWLYTLMWWGLAAVFLVLIALGLGAANAVFSGAEWLNGLSVLSAQLAFGGALFVCWTAWRAAGGRGHLGGERVSKGFLWLAVVGGGATVGWLPSRAAELFEISFDWSSALTDLSLMIQFGDEITRLLLAIGIIVVAPIVEELVFRGYFWRTLERHLPQGAVWLITSLLFAAMHLDPVQALAVLPLGLFLGWTRYFGGSVWPCVIGHMINNLLGFMVILLGWEFANLPWAVATSMFATGMMILMALPEVRTMEPTVRGSAS